MTTLTPSVFDFVEDYANELASRDDLPTDLDEEEGLVVFAREFFIQFFGEVLGYEILTFDDGAGVDVFVADKERSPGGSSADPIVAKFREFCQNYKTIIGEHYDRSGERSDFQRAFVPALLEDVQMWAKDHDRDDLAQAAGHALTVIKEALAKIGDST